jgi:hypothetical protein
MRHRVVGKKRKNRLEAAMAAGRLPTLADARADQLEPIREKFGRQPQPGDLVCFDPVADKPTRSDEKIRAEVIAIMQSAGTPLQIVYAYRKTGLLLIAGLHPPESRDWKDWNAAIDEYFALERKARSESI